KVCDASGCFLLPPASRADGARGQIVQRRAPRYRRWGVSMRWVDYMPLHGGSKSIPGKNIRLRAGRPLFSWALGAALDSASFDEVWVGTDSDAIATSVQQIFEDRVRVFRRAAHTCTDEASTESAQLEFAQAVPFTVLCTIQATSP